MPDQYLTDASSIIYGWDNYPIGQFPGLWNWIASQIESEALIIPAVALEEVNDNSSECGEWMMDQDIVKVHSQNAILQDAMRVKHLLGITNEDYHPKGVGENDLIIIATARFCGRTLISDENRQKLPELPKKRKIPAVCSMREVAVQCINFLDYIKQSAVIFR